MANRKNKLLVIVGKIAESLGLDLVPYALGFIKFKGDAPFETTKLQEIQNKVSGLSEAKVIEEALSYCKELLDDENERGEKIENKAFNLIGVTGISTAFITGITSLVSDQISNLPFWLIPFLYVLIVLSLTLTVSLAFRVIKVGEYKHAHPDIEGVFHMSSMKLGDIRKERVATYVYSYERNYQIHTIKASYLIGAQVWFRNAVILFLILAFALAVNISSITTLVSPSASSTVSATPNSTAALPLAPTTILPTFSLTPVPTYPQTTVLTTRPPTSTATQPPLPSSTYSPSPSQTATAIAP